MREILFRGKQKASGAWLHGDLRQWSEKRKGICDYALGRTLDVYPETVGQYTGLTDKNGKKIFEGDIVRGRHWTSYNDKKPEDFHLWRVDWSEESGLITFVDSPTTKARMSIHDFADFGEVEVIGNIHDNPELLGGAEDG